MELQSKLELPTRAYHDSLHENFRNRRDLSTVLNDQVNEFDNNNLAKLYTITDNRYPSSDIDLANEKEVDGSLGESTKVRFNQTLQNCIKVSVGKDV